MTFPQASSIHMQYDFSLHALEQPSYDQIAIRDLKMPYWVVSHVKSGRIETITGDEQAAATTGDVMIHPPNVAFSEIATLPGTHQWFAFNLRLHPGVELFQLHQIGLVVKLADSRLYSELFADLLRSWQDASNPFRDISTSAIALQLLSMVLQSWKQAGCLPRPSNITLQEERFQSAIAYLSANLHAKITRKDIAELLYLNPSYLDRAFSNVYGQTPMSLLREMRLKKAKSMLENSNVPLDDIAKACGLGDPAYLSRFFLKHANVTPGAFRKQAHALSRAYIR